ncbi:Formate hydrogenlyase subunit 7 [Mucinivorans hirudinis]|uniref:Formate hydrogenlyase subunit 7 n=1 Tax=Mucinivorans hirudinis TaxID=1433126 RepID=A0A060RCV1_9BACT|nr:Formate hydrogenlyase subunit 7 [Mucinivorans hirudinis]
MLKSTVNTLREHGYQAIRELDKVVLTEKFRGRVVLRSSGLDEAKFLQTAQMCPVGALSVAGLDMGRCIFCKECSFRHPENIIFTNDYHLATSVREELIILFDTPTKPYTITQNPLFKNSLKLRQISAGGDGSNEMELNAAGNVNFDMARYGIEFTASPRHADGVVITGPITRNMARETQLVLDATPDPKLIILAGTDAISGGLFADSPAIYRQFIDNNHINLYIAGNPVHPLSFILGLKPPKL